MLGTLRSLCAGLLNTIPALATTTTEFAADAAAVSAQQSDNLTDGLFGFQDAKNLVSFFSTEVLVHLATLT